MSPKTVDIVDEETGEVTTETRVTGAPGSIYARFYDEHSSRTGRGIRTST
jgi:hypothetical protein